MRTVHITNAWHTASGGIATFYRALLEAAETERVHVALVTPGEDDRMEETGSYGRIYSVRSPSAPFNTGYRFLPLSSYAAPDSRVQTILRREQPRLVEISDKYSLPFLAGLLRRGWLPGLRERPTVVGLSCERMSDNVAAYVTGGWLAQRFVHTYLRWVYFPLCDHHIAVSSYTAEELAEVSPGHACRRGVWILPPGVDARTFRPGLRSPERRRRLAARVGAGPDSILLLYCGRLAPEKNLDLLTGLLPRLALGSAADFRLVIAGDGVLRERFLREAGRRAPGKICSLGFVKGRDELASLYANCDAFIHPNPREPFGIAPLEAMAAGLPLVAPNRGGVTTYAGPSNAWLADPDSAGFARAVLEILRDPGETRRRVEAARLTAEARDWPVVASAYLRLYQAIDLLTRGGPAPQWPPAFYSTPGDRFGREIRLAEHSHVEMF
jgi:glycosyltransferase involved in cell wall biosynthesis